MPKDIHLVHVFSYGASGGNPCPIVCDADGMRDADMQAVARKYGHESGFVFSPPDRCFDHAFRFWVPNHEMEMCGHATIGALWVLASWYGDMSPVKRIRTPSGPVTAFVSTDANGVPEVEITQPIGHVQDLGRAAADRVLSVLRLRKEDVLDVPIQNAWTARVKTLVPIRNLDRLNALAPDFDAMESLCEAIGSTGLYPYAPHSDAPRTFDARQFPKSSGYPEDPATGIAATALASGLLRNRLVDGSSSAICIFQGRRMGSLSRMVVRLGFVGNRSIGCLLGGSVTPVEAQPMIGP